MVRLPPRPYICDIASIRLSPHPFAPLESALRWRPAQSCLHCITLLRTQGYAFVEFVERTEAEQAQLYLDGGQVGKIVRRSPSPNLHSDTDNFLTLSYERHCSSLAGGRGLPVAGAV